MEKPTIEDMILKSIAKNQEPPRVRFIEYNDMGERMERVIVLHSRNGEGRLMCLLANGKPTDDLCPCCMSFRTRANIMRIIKESHLKTVVWVGVHAKVVRDYFPALHSPVSESETEVRYSV